jgi:hypothetical protein
MGHTTALQLSEHEVVMPGLSKDEIREEKKLLLSTCERRGQASLRVVTIIYRLMKGPRRNRNTFHSRAKCLFTIVSDGTFHLFWLFSGIENEEPEPSSWTISIQRSRTSTPLGPALLVLLADPPSPRKTDKLLFFYGAGEDASRKNLDNRFEPFYKSERIHKHSQKTSLSTRTLGRALLRTCCIWTDLSPDIFLALRQGGGGARICGSL